MQSVVVYYSNTGNNRYLAEKAAKNMHCDIVKIEPRLNVFLFLLFGMNPGIKTIPVNLSEYDKVILVGPIWMGKFISPLRSFVKKYGRSINKMYFLTCCGSSYAVKDEKFGHELVFKIIKNILGDKCVMCRALPIGLVVHEDKQEDNDAIMKTRLYDDNFKGEIQERFESFIEQVKKG